MRYSRADLSIKISPYETSFISSISFWKKQHDNKTLGFTWACMDSLV